MATSPQRSSIATSPRLPVSTDPHTVARRFAVYRNNVTVSLVDALAAIYPTLQNLVGEDFFRAMANDYVRDNLPTSPLMFTYGASFPTFVESFGPARDLPFLPDVARVERAWLDAFTQPTAPPLTRSPSRTWHRIPCPRYVSNLIQPAICSDCPMPRHHRRSRPAGLPLDGLDPFQPEAVLITRPAYDVSVTVLTAAASVFIDALMTGGTFAQACDAAESADPGADIAGLLTLTLASGAFSGLRLPETGIPG